LLAHYGRGLLVHRRRARLLEQDRAISIAGHADREPAHVPEGDVVDDPKAKLPDVEVERLVLVEHVDRGDAK
jgi:hypothetical protein